MKVTFYYLVNPIFIYRWSNYLGFVLFQLDTPTLQEGELNELLDQCARSISRTSFADVDSSRCTSTENNTPRYEYIYLLLLLMLKVRFFSLLVSLICGKIEML